MITIKKITDSAYRRYGKVVNGYELDDLFEAMKATPVPEDVVYVGSVPALEQTKAAKAFGDRFFGGMPIQVGYCNGHNSLMNALEYHRNCEINVAVTDQIILVGALQDVTDDFTYDTSLAEAFFVPAGTVFQMYETTLHYAPCGADGKGFQNVVILPKGTNEECTPDPDAVGEDKLRTHVNKWLIAHPDAKIPGAWNGLIGENISVAE